MTTFSQNDYQSLLVGKSGASLKDATTVNALADGEIGIFTPAGVKLTELAAASTDRFILAVGRGTGIAPLQTPVINKNKVTSKGKKVTVAATEQVDYIGYNTSSGAIEVANSTVYRAAISIKEGITQNHGGIYIKDMTYKSDASATQAEIADGLIKSAIANFSREAEKGIKFERVTSSATTNPATGTLAVVNGSKYVTAATDIDAGPAAVGDYFSISGIAYKIVALNVGGTTTVAELDIPYQGATDAAIADASILLISAAAAAAGNWGIKMTGVELGFTVGKLSYRKMRWVTTLNTDAFGATPITKSATATLGSGVYEQIAELEWFVNGNNGEFLRMGEPNLFSRVSLVADEPYDLITINFYDERVDTLSHVTSPKVVTLAIPNATPGYALSSTTDDITDVLEVLLYGAANNELAI